MDIENQDNWRGKVIYQYASWTIWCWEKCSKENWGSKRDRKRYQFRWKYWSKNIAKDKENSTTNVKQKDDRPKSGNNNQSSPKNKSHEASDIVLEGTAKEIKSWTSQTQVVKKIDDSKDSDVLNDIINSQKLN